MIINVLIIEDEILVAENIRNILQKQTDCTFIIVDNEEDALKTYKKERIDLIISDIHLNNSIDGPCIVKKMQEERPVPVIYLTAYSDKQYIESALETEPVTYLIKPFLERQLLVAFSIALNKVKKEEPDNRILKPSARELQIIELLIKGFNSREMSDMLFVSEHTIKTHRKNLLKKYNVSSTYELIALSSKLNWVKNEPS